MRRSDVFLFTLVGGAALFACLVGVEALRADAGARLDAERELVGKLGLTDLCLCTEARFTRHPTQADRHAAFQEAPGAMDLFPSGSIIGPGQ